MQYRNQFLKGFTLIEMLIVLSIIGAITMLIAPSFKSTTSGATSKQIYDFTSNAANNWRLINMKCGTSTDTTASPVVSTPSVSRSLGLVVNGTAYLVTGTYQGCYDEAGVNALHSKATGNPTDGFRVSGYTVTWSGGGSSAITFVVTGVPVEIALPLYKQLSSATGAQIATAMPAAADTTDAAIRFTAPAGGLTTLTLIYL